MHILLSSIFLLSNLFPSLHYCTAMENITSIQPLTQEQTLTSPGQVFELGFFSPDNTRNRYVGMWHMNAYPRKVVWVANRDRPLTVTDTLANLTIGSDGNLKLVDGRQITVWSTNVSVPLNDSFAAISDKGNLVLQLQSSPSGEVLWQSFDFPCDTILQGASIGMNSKTGEKRFLISWKGEDDPSPGKFIFGVLPEVPPQAFIWNGTNIYWRTGEWDRTTFIGIPEMADSYTNGYDLQQNLEQGSVYLTVDDPSNLSALYLVLTSAGSLKITYWDEDEKQWLTDWEAPKSRCDVYGVCGPFGVCKETNSPICRCLRGFVPKSSVEWSKGNWTRGCVRKTELLCEKNNSSSGKGKKDGFLKMDGMKLPDSSEFVYPPFGTEECESWCSSNCSCLAYAYVNKIGCMIWTTDLVDIQEFSSLGKDLCIRVAHSELGGGKKQKERLTISFTVVCIFIFLGVAVFLFMWKAKQREKVKETMKNSNVADSDTTNNSRDPTMENVWRNHLTPQDSTELPMFDFHSILVATNNFSVINKLGQGGFGPVYKGTLQDGKEIAVKRLSNSSGQGIEEFKNETILISKLQHRNLVRILGCCIEGEEKLLVYEYMPNKSLDKFLFDPTKGVQLGWAKRFNIIQGIARGLLYLHRDSCLRVIHRDLKVSNILLDEDMNPKISDFGLARTFQEAQDLANTHRVVGTFGYMSPEYAMGGIFSEKSDVFSLGVLLLEIVSGKRNASFQYCDQHLNLIGFAWQLWNANRGLDLMDKALGESFSPLEVLRCLHVGLLCVQDHAADRPIMSTVVFMLSNETELPQPKQPVFIFQSSLDYSLQSQSEKMRSTNEVTISMVEGR